jgi:dTDP-4-dehydrorhamnose reductase
MTAYASSEPLRILILGSTGQLGRELQRSFAATGSVDRSVDGSIVAAGRNDVDLAHSDQIRAFVRGVKPNLILNAAAYTAVDRAESEPQLAYAINAECPRILAEEALALNALLVHYSTDYVFDGSKSGSWIETDTPAPLNAYGTSKLAGEQALLAVGGRILIFRTSWVYGPHGSNFLLTMLRLGRERDRLSIVDDQFGAPTTSIALARASRAIVTGILGGQFGSTHDWAGLYHMTCSGSTTWFGFARAIFAGPGQLLAAKVPEIMPIGTSEYPTPAARPRNSVLSNEKLGARFGVQLPSWQSALEETLQVLQRQSTP